MPSVPPAAVRKEIATRALQPVYLLIGDDDGEMSRLVADISSVVDDQLRAFNTERIYADDRSSTTASIVESARTLPMLGDRRVVIVLRAERLLKPKRRSKTAAPEETAGDDAEASPGESDILEEYVRNPEALTTLVLVASDADRTRKLYRTLMKSATVVECWGLKRLARNPRDVKGWELEQIAREAVAVVNRTVKEAGCTIEPAAAALLARRAGSDIVTLRGDLERLLLYAGERKAIGVRDVQDVASAETLQDHWALADAILRRDVKKALRQLGLALESGSVPYMILGQLGYCVREKVAAADARRVPAAVEALFRTDQEIKSSGGDPRVLLERLVVELCGG